MPDVHNTGHLPYRDPSVGDLIIRTSDGIEFHVHRRRIADASPVFADMFLLPDGASTDQEKQEKALVDVSESSKIWEKLLSICYLEDSPPRMEDLMHLWEAGRKYNIAGVMNRMKGFLNSSFYMDEKPFAVYALACALDVPEVARAAARRSLLHPVFPYDTPEFSAVSGRAVFQLLDYRRRCGAAAKAIVNLRHANWRNPLPAWCSESEIRGEFRTCGSTACHNQSPVGTMFHGHEDSPLTLHFRITWVGYFRTLGEKLEYNPDGAIACNPSLLEPVIVSAAHCPVCASKAYSQAIAISSKVKQMIDDAIAQVSTLRKRGL